MKQLTIFSLLLLATSFGCGENPLAFDENTNSRGSTTIYVEQNVEPLIETSIMAFEGIRPKAHIVPKYKRELDIINSFIDKKTKAIIISRDFSKEERKEFSQVNVSFKTNKLAIGAIALIGPDGDDSTYTEEEFLKLLTTTDKNAPKIVFDDVQSANFNYFLDRIAPKSFGPNVKCLQTNLEVINFVRQNKNCIGVIGFNWISDRDDPEVLKRLKNIRLIEIAKGNGTEFVPPYMYYVYEKQYPFTHYWYVHNKGSKSDLEAGFVNFLINEKGQLVIKKSGMQPYYRISREFNIVVE